MIKNTTLGRGTVKVSRQRSAGEDLLHITITARDASSFRAAVNSVLRDTATIKTVESAICTTETSESCAKSKSI